MIADLTYLCNNSIICVISELELLIIYAYVSCILFYFLVLCMPRNFGLYPGHVVYFILLDSGSCLYPMAIKLILSSEYV